MDQVLQPSVVFDSRGMRPADALDAWHEIARPTLEIGIDDGDRDRFSLSLRVVRLVETFVSAAETTSQAMHRDLHRIHRDGLDQYGFFLQVTGSRVTRVNGTDAILKPGDLQFVDMAQEDTSIASDGRTTTLYVPRQLVEADVPDAWKLHGTVYRNGATQVFAHQALSLFSPNSGWTTTMAAYLERSLLAIAIGCLFESRFDSSPSTSTIDRPLRRSIERYIEDNLADHELDGSRICQEFGLSRSVVYRMFQPHNGLNRYILGCRLRRVRRLLLDRDDRSIAEIAYACGFVSPAHFSREFRRAFGAAPSEMRQQRSGIGHVPVQASSLDQLLRSLTH